MQKFWLKTFVFSSLFLFIGCLSLTDKFPSAQAVNASIDQSKNQHGRLNPGQTESTTQIVLNLPENITLSEPTTLEIDVQDLSGQPISDFDKIQENLMYLTIVNDDLSFFRQIYPVYQGNGKFTADVTFSRVGNYTFFTDYRPDRQGEQIAATKFTLPGKVTKLPKIFSFDREENVDGIQVNFSASTPTIKAGKEVNLIFDLDDATNNMPIQDRESYSGTRPSLVIIRNSENLTTADYIHTRAFTNTDKNGQISFSTTFPQSGIYKLWMQFNYQGSVRIANFWVNVE